MDMGEESGKKQKKGAPDWMVTFSDLMTLLLTFFVLLLSMAETSTPKIETGIRSLREAFSGEKIIGSNMNDYIVVSSPFADPKRKKEHEYTIKKIEETKIDQQLDFLKKQQDFLKNKQSDSLNKQQSNPKQQQQLDSLEKLIKSLEAIKQKNVEEARRLLEFLEKQIKHTIAEELKDKILLMESKNDMITIRFPGDPTFQSGSADLSPDIIPVIKKLANILDSSSVSLAISGYTDPVPIHNSRFRSNWDLSTARAVSVAHVLLNNGSFVAEQVIVAGHAYGYPLVPNDTKENRAINRRVEITIKTDEGFMTRETLHKYFE